MGASVRADGLTMIYEGKPAVDDVSFEVAPGEFFGLLGPNGAGKTTTLEMLEGLRKPASGTATIDGHEPWKRELPLLRRIGVQLQASSFFEKLTAREQLDHFRRLYGAGADRVDIMLEEVGLVEKADSKVDDLSGGQKQRLSIACALVHDPEVVFLDEPTAALDPQARRNLWDLLRGLNDSGRTVILTTHYMDEAELLCDRVAIIDNGQILKLDTPQALIRGLAAAVRIQIASGRLSAAEAEGLAGVESSTDDGDTIELITHRPADVLSALAGINALDGLAVHGATLEDVFLDLTGREYRA